MSMSVHALNQLYLAYFGRPVDVVGLSYFATKSTEEVVLAFDASAESQALYGSDPVSKIHAIYNNLFNRDAELNGLAYWISEIESGRVTAPEAALVILQNAQGTDATVVANKLKAANAFAAAMDTAQEQAGYSGAQAAASARAWLKSVGLSDASVQAAVQGAQLALDNAVQAGSSQISYATAQSDWPVFTVGSDVLVTRFGEPGQAEVQKIAVSGTLQQGDAFSFTWGDGATRVHSGPLAQASVAELAKQLEAAKGGAPLSFSAGAGPDAGLLIVTAQQAGNVAGTAVLQQTAVAGVTLSPGVREVQSITLKGTPAAGDAVKITLPGGMVLVADGLKLEAATTASGSTSLALGYAQDIAVKLNAQLEALQGDHPTVVFTAGYLGSQQGEYPVLTLQFRDAGVQPGTVVAEQTYVAGVAVTSANQAQVFKPEYKVDAGVAADRPSVTTQVAVVDGRGVERSTSSLEALDTLVGFVIGIDKIDLQTAAGADLPAPQSLLRVPDILWLDAESLQAQLPVSLGHLDAQSAGLLVIHGGSAAGTYLYVNDAQAAFSAVEDVFIKLVGTTGPLGAVGALAVSDFFA